MAVEITVAGRLTAGFSWGERKQKTAINLNFIQVDANIVNSFSRFLNGYLQQSIEFHLLRSWEFDSSSWFSLKSQFYLPVLLLMLKISQWENLDKYCRKRNSCYTNPIMLIKKKKKRNSLSNKQLNHDPHDSQLFDIAKLTGHGIQPVSSFWWIFYVDQSFSRKILQWNKILQSTGHKWRLCHRSRW